MENLKQWFSKCDSKIWELIEMETLGLYPTPTLTY